MKAKKENKTKWLNKLKKHFDDELMKEEYYYETGFGIVNKYLMRTCLVLVVFILLIGTLNLPQEENISIIFNMSCILMFVFFIYVIINLALSIVPTFKSFDLGAKKDMIKIVFLNFTWLVISYFIVFVSSLYYKLDIEHLFSEDRLINTLSSYSSTINVLTNVVVISICIRIILIIYRIHIKTKSKKDEIRQ